MSSLDPALDICDGYSYSLDTGELDFAFGEKLDVWSMSDDGTVAQGYLAGLRDRPITIIYSLYKDGTLVKQEKVHVVAEFHPEWLNWGFQNEWRKTTVVGFRLSLLKKNLKLEEDPNVLRTGIYGQQFSYESSL